MGVDFDFGPNPIDRHVGRRIRLRRKQLKITQEDLAASIGLTFQQVQKYERAANRVSASKLWEVACALNVPVSYFFEDLDLGPSQEGDRSGDAVEDFLLTADGAELAETFPRIASPSLRQEVMELVRVLAEDSDVGPASRAQPALGGT